MTNHSHFTIGALCAMALAATTARAQIDPEPRQLLHLGFNQPLKDDGPRAAYAFFYWNMPDFPYTNQTLRLAIAPVYVDGELGFKGLLGPNTDLGVGVFGGAFANSYEEVRRGNYYRDESFTGNGGGASVNVYHLFNPNAMIPLNGILSGRVNYNSFSDRDETGAKFVLPDDQPIVTLKTGLRFGGKEPVIGPRLAMELSGWYEVQYRPNSGTYGYNDDRELRSTSQRILGRALINWTTPEWEHYLTVGIMGGVVINPDRFSAYRVGGALPFTSEFPLYLPGYFYGELSAKQFGLAYTTYSIPLDPEKRWMITAMGATAVVGYAPGLDQPGNMHTGAGGGLSYTSKERKWRVMAGFGYGFDAIRDDGRGGENVGLIFQYNFGKKKFASDEAFDQLQGARVPVK